MFLNTMRHDALFDHMRFNEDIHVVGVGGVGSFTVMHLLMLGCGAASALHVYDADTVASHNLCNQIYDPRHLHFPKVEALRMLQEEWGGAPLHIHHEAVTGSTPMSGVVFVCVDSMLARKIIWETCVRHKPDVSLMIETRMDADKVFIHVVNPNNPVHIERWEHYWYPDEQAVNLTAGCGGHIAVGPTASATADIAVWQFIRYAALRLGEDEELDNQIKFRLRPLSLETEQW